MFTDASLRDTTCPPPSPLRGTEAIPVPEVRELPHEANTIQVGGTHYQKPIQPWDYVAANGLGFFEGNALKYLTRWREKGGVEDLRKAGHYIQKLIEIETARAGNG